MYDRKMVLDQSFQYSSTIKKQGLKRLPSVSEILVVPCSQPTLKLPPININSTNEQTEQTAIQSNILPRFLHFELDDVQTPSSGFSPVPKLHLPEYLGSTRTSFTATLETEEGTEIVGAFTKGGVLISDTGSVTFDRLKLRAFATLKKNLKDIGVNIMRERFRIRIVTTLGVGFLSSCFQIRHNKL